MRAPSRVYFQILIIRMFTFVVIKTDVKSNLPCKAVIFKDIRFMFFQLKHIRDFLRFQALSSFRPRKRGCA